jgi:hypothetical protein
MNKTGKQLSVLLLCGIALSQSLTSQDFQNIDNISVSSPKPLPIYDVKKSEKLTIIKNNENKFVPGFERIIPEFMYNYTRREQKQSVPKFDIVSSFRSNI